MKYIPISLVVLLAILVSFGTGCATALRGTHRELRAVSNIPNTKFTLIREGSDGVQEKVGLNRSFDLNTPDRKQFTITAETPGGQRDLRTVEWTPAGIISVVGGALGFGIPFGVGGVISAGVDVLTGAYSDPKTNEVVFWFDPNKEKQTVDRVRQAVQQPVLVPKIPACSAPTLPAQKDSGPFSNQVPDSWGPPLSTQNTGTPFRRSAPTIIQR